MASSVSKRIFGADLNEDIKKVLQQRQKLAKEAQPLDSTQLDSEDYKVNFLDKDEKILTDLGSRTPFVRIWTAVQVQKHDQKDKNGIKNVFRSVEAESILGTSKEKPADVLSRRVDNDASYLTE